MRFPLHAFAAMLTLTPMTSASELTVSQPQSKLWVEGTSSVKSFQCSVTDFALTVNTEGSGAVAAVLAGEKAVRTVELTVPAAKIDCGNGSMNDHMRKAIKLAEAPTIRFKLSGYDVARATDGVKGTMRGGLSLGGAERSVDVTAAGAQAGEGSLRVTGSADISMKAFDLKAPTLMFGRIKVGDQVKVRFDLVLKS